MSNVSKKNSDKSEIDRLRRENAEREWENAIDRVIEEALKAGKFENLPGQGKPLQLNKNPYAQEQALAFELLQNNDYTLPWIAERNELLEAVADLREELITAWQRYRRRMHAPDPTQEPAQRAWDAYLREMEVAVTALNKKIDHANMNIPVARLELLKLNLDRELARAGAARTLTPLGK
ncbi:MAG: DnaJ family domain-containing protein [Candidatus Promineifilaceae bacterium]|nr:DnaJ family domain-containing protein [Candidatus Promineifilaceae bacterium]